MKKIKLFLVLLLVTIIPVTVLAVEETKVENLENLKACVKKSGSLCKLGGNIILDSVLEVGGEITIDLNNYSITPKTEGYADDSVITVLRGGKLTVKDSGTKGAIDAGEVAVGIKITKKGENDDTNPATLIVDGGRIKGKSFAISGNGYRHNTSITVNDGILEGSTVIYHPQKGTLVVNGGTLSGSKTGIELRSGTLTVNGGTITGNGNPFEQEQNGSGTTTIGAGVAVVQHTTQYPASATINGGTIKGYRSIVQNNVQNNNEEAIKKVSLTINNGNFEIINEGDYVVNSDNLEKFISGGKYSNEVDSKYLKDNYISKKIGDNYVIALPRTVTLSEVKNGTASVSGKEGLVVGETVTITTKANEGYEISALKVVDTNKKEIEVKNGKFIMPNSNVTVTVEFSKITHTVDLPTVIVPEEEVEELVVGIENTEEIKEILLDSLMEYDIVESLDNSMTVALEVENKDVKDIDEEIIEKMEEVAGKAKIANYFDITVAIKNKNDDSTVGIIPELTKEIELTILLPENLKNTNKDVNRVYYVVRRHVDENNKESFELIEAKLSDDEKYLVFKTDKFSTYALAYEDVKVYEILPPKTFDGISTYVIIATLSLIGFVGISIYLKKENI